MSKLNIVKKNMQKNFLKLNISLHKLENCSHV